MLEKLKIKSIIINKKEYEVIQLTNYENGIKFKLNSDIQSCFKLSHKTIPLNYLKVRTKNNDIYTLFNCFYTIRNNDYDYIHIIYNEIVKENVDTRNFSCNKLIINMELLNSYQLFSKKIKISIDDITICQKNYKNKSKVIILSNHYTNADSLFEYFIQYFELINFIIGYFPKVKRTIYYKDKIKYIVINKLVSKYITSNEYRKNDLYILDITDTKLLTSVYKKYMTFNKNSRIQLDMFFLATMKSGSYIDTDTVNILQVFDGIYNKLEAFKDLEEEYPCEMNDEIIEFLNKFDFSSIKSKYESIVDINAKVCESLKRTYLVNYRKKLKNIFKYNDYCIFKNERIKNNEPFIKYDTLITKCVNSRNKISHSDENNELLYLSGIECACYIHKFILIFRLLIFQEIGLDIYINYITFDNLLNNINRYIEEQLNKCNS